MTRDHLVGNRKSSNNQRDISKKVRARLKKLPLAKSATV